MILKDFELQPYQTNNQVHRRVIIDLINDNDSFEALGDLSYLLKYFDGVEVLDGFYIVYYNNEAIGIITLANVGSDKYYITYGLTKEYRGRKLSSLLLNEFSDQVFIDHDDINELNLFIKTGNEISRKTAYSAGYINDSEVIFKKRK